MPFSVETALEHAIQVSDELGAWHRQNRIYKYLLPENILVEKKSKKLRLSETPTAQPAYIASPYASPEQSGRMNRRTDWRTDFYSLGVVFYEWLTGQLPFQASDALGWVHAHLAKPPIPPQAFRSDIPPMLSELVLKCLAKNPEERYQSVSGLKADLEECRDQWRHSQHISRFLLGQHDMSDKFHVPQKLYGREREVARLQSAWQEARRGRKNMVRATGLSGVGKSALIEEMRQPVWEQHGFWAAGKFDQFQRDVPYHAIVQAFQGIVRQLLTERESALQKWKQKLSDALGMNAQVLIDLIPDLEWILGKQPAVPSLPPTESQNRFHLVFQNFIRVLAGRPHPLVLFIDDLQWADLASLKLLEILIDDPAIHYFLLIGAYRDQDVANPSPLQVTLDVLKQGDVPCTEIEVKPLEREDVTQLVADTLQTAPSLVHPLSNLVQEKTSGNPFFVQQFLYSLYDRKLFRLNEQNRRWDWDLEQIRDLDITDNVVELMVDKIRNLPEASQQILPLAACIGNVFDLSTLAVIREIDPKAVLEELAPSIQEGLLLDTDDASDSEVRLFRFLHDRVQQAAYALITEAEKPSLHLKIGRLLLNQMTQSEGKDSFFEIVNHLNAGSELLQATEEIQNVIQLNLAVGCKAKRATAYRQARDYFQKGISLLPSDAWTSCYDITFDLYRECSECEYLTGNFSEAEQLFDMLYQKVQSPVEKTRVARIKMAMYANLSRHQEAVDTALECLSWFDVIFLDTLPLEEENELYLEFVEKLGGTEGIQQLLHNPDMEDEEQLVIMSILAQMIPSSYALQHSSVSQLGYEALKRSIQYGNAPASVMIYGQFGITIGVYLSHFKEGAAFGQLGCQLAEHFNDPFLKGRGYHHWAFFIPWVKHIREALPCLKSAVQYCFEAGDLNYAGYAVSTIPTFKYLNDDPLPDVMAEFEQALSIVERHRDRGNMDYLKALHSVILSLVSSNQHRDDSETQALFSLMKERAEVSSLGWCYVLQMGVLYLWEEDETAFELLPYIEELLGSRVAGIHSVEHEFYLALFLIRRLIKGNAETALSEEWLDRLNQARNRLSAWSALNPDAFLHKTLLVEAEYAVAHNDPFVAQKSYRQAIQHAETQGFCRHVAIIHERAAEFHQSYGFEDYAKLHWQKAVEGYERWGALFKVERLQAFRVASEPDPSLDWVSAIKASQAISGNIVLQHLLERMIHILIENAGAEKGRLILEKEGVLDTSSEPNVSQAVVQYVIRTQQPVVLDDATQSETFQHDSYIQRMFPKSILCLPLLHQGELLGVLYAENNLTTGAFTKGRLEVLQLLAAQAAISIRNATLYLELQTASEQLQQSHSQLEVYNQNLETTVNQRTEELQMKNAALLEANQLLRQIFDGMAEGVMTLDKQFRVRMISTKACHMIGVEEADVLKKPAASILGGTIAGPSGFLMQCVQSEAGVSDVHTQLLCPSGAVLPVGLTIMPLQPAIPHAVWLLFLKDRREEERLLRASGGTTFGTIISTDSQMQSIFKLIDTVATSNSTVLIQGESGTGKELVAREVHDRSQRAQMPFYAINCAAIPANLLESEFFGYERGAFTGAQQSKPGHFELANRGTLFLDEVGEIPIELQGKLLRSLQERKLRRLGSTRSIEVDVRVVAATNRDLQSMVKQQQFREDLYYRLDVISIQLPPLRERLHDIPLLAKAFIEELNHRDQRAVQSLSPEVMPILMNYDWPGNIRELYNVVEYAFALSDSLVLRPEHLPSKLQERPIAEDSTSHAPLSEKETILRALQQASFRKGKAAALLGMSDSTLYRKRKKFGI